MPKEGVAKAFNDAVQLHGKRAVVVGGTSGIGLSIARRLASLGASIGVAGRNKEAGEALVAEFKAANPDGKHEFLPIDASSMKDVKRFSEEVKSKYPTLNYLVVTCGFLSTAGRTETPEGIDKKLATHYYGRHLLIRELIPVLEKTASIGEDVRVLTVLAAGKGKAAPEDDFDLKKHFSLKVAGEVGPFHNDLMVDEFSRRHPSITFMHPYPGIVKTNISNGLPTVLNWLSKGLMHVIAVSAETCGEYMTYGLLSDKYKKGFWLLNDTGDSVDKVKQHTDEMRQKVWDHTVQLTEEALSREAPTGSQ
eukprot:Colp12_sorted_trinity150504_noHs@12017